MIKPILQKSHVLVCCLVIQVLWSLNSQAQMQQHALVVGINRYQYADGNQPE